MLKKSRSRQNFAFPLSSSVHKKYLYTFYYIYAIYRLCTKYIICPPHGIYDSFQKHPEKKKTCLDSLLEGMKTTEMYFLLFWLRTVYYTKYSTYIYIYIQNRIYVVYITFASASIVYTYTMWLCGIHIFEKCITKMCSSERLK